MIIISQWDMDNVEYFRWMSPLASRITADIELTKSAYQELWRGLTQSEKDQVINEAIIDPGVVLKYNSHTKAVGKVKANSTFCWFTKSQLDLYSQSIKAIEKSQSTSNNRKKGPAPEAPVRKESAVANEQVADTSCVQSNQVQGNSCAQQPLPTPPTNPLRVILPSPVATVKKRALIASPPSEPNNLFARLKNRQKCEDQQPLVETETAVSVMRTKTDGAVDRSVQRVGVGVDRSVHRVGVGVDRSVHRVGVAKPNTPPPPPPPTTTNTTESLSLLSHDEADSIPKTGFDFLDNW